VNVAVVGGTGLIGRHAAVELLARGHAVTLLSRRPPAEPLDGTRHVPFDLTARAVGGVLDGADALVHAGGTDYRVLPHGSAERFFRRLNVDATVRLLEAAIASGVKRAVLVTSFYPGVLPGATVAEHPYLATRVEEEERALAACDGKLPLAIVQPPFVIGHAPGRASLGATLAAWVRSRAPLLAPPGGSSFLTARALGEAIATALERGRAGARYLVGDENLRWSELLERFARAAGRSERPLLVPRALLTAAAFAVDVFARAGGREPGVRPIEWSRLWASEMFYDASAARDELGHCVGDLDETIAELVAAA
jgi:nucleoside-diphosphate-sugar epimerase